MIRRLYKEQIFDMGTWMEIMIYPVFRKSKRRGAKYRPTSDMQKHVNRKNAIYKLFRLLMWNFTERDIFLDLTYAPEHCPASRDEAQRNVRNFLRRLRLYMSKRDIELKYIYVTEEGKRSHRFHHHLVISGGVSMQEIEALWGMGYTKCSAPSPDEAGFYAKAMYMYKQIGADTEDEEELQNEEQKHIKGWSGSRNLIRKDPAERNGRLGAEKVRDAAQEIENGIYKSLCAYYKGHEVGYAEASENFVNDGYFIHAILYNTEKYIKRKRGFLNDIKGRGNT